jgi:cullin-associated NEDD8-dissociated protein 1
VSTACIILKEVANLLTSSDLTTTDLSLKVVGSLVVRYGVTNASVEETLQKDVISRVLELASSSLIQGGAQDSLIELLQVIVHSNASLLCYNDLINVLLEKSIPANGKLFLPKQAAMNISKCIASISIIKSSEVCVSCFSAFLNDLNNSNAPDHRKVLGLYTIGYIGQRVDLRTLSTNVNNDVVKNTILRSFDSGVEDIKSATAFALGNIAVGNMQTYLPILLESSTFPPNQYLLLVALKEVILVHSLLNIPFDPYLEIVQGNLVLQSTCEDESIRNAVADCIGGLAVSHGVSILHWMHSTIQQVTDKRFVWTLCTAMRYALSKLSYNIGSEHGFVIEPFLQFLNDEDLELRRASLLMVNAAVHYTPYLITSYLAEHVVPHLIAMLTFKMERIVDLGPFKHRVITLSVIYYQIMF